MNENIVVMEDNEGIPSDTWVESDAYTKGGMKWQ